MPAKPIKHGIKMFDICCALSAILLGFKVYVGQEEDSNYIDLGIYGELVKEAGTTSVRGKMLYTDNYFTLMAIAKHIFNQYGWTIFVSF